MAMDDTDLRGLDLDGAKAYLFEFAASAKALAKELSGLEGELSLWKSRVGLAEQKGVLELAEAARKRVAELEAKAVSLRAEKAELEGKVARIREQLPLVAARERSVDADRLLAELQLMTGTLLAPEGAESAAATEAEFRTLEAASTLDAELQALKRKAGGGQ